MVLRCVISDSEFRQKTIKMLCINPKDGKPIKDFSTDINNALYSAQVMFVQLTGGRVEMPLQFAESILTQMSETSDLIGPDEVSQAMMHLRTIMELQIQPSKAMVMDGFRIWLGKRRAERVIRAHTAFPTWSASDMLDETRLNNAAIDLTEGEDSFVEFGVGLDTQKLDIHRIPLNGLRSLSQAIGGGFANKEATLVVAPEGSGKTILGCQIASVLASQQNQVGIFVSTEQGSEELEPRVISCNCQIPYDLIKDKFHVSMLNAEQLKRYHAFREAIKGKLFWENWGVGDHNMSIENDLMELITRREEQIGRKVNFLVLDWIGGALGKLRAEDHERITPSLQLAGDTVAQVAKERDMYTIAFAQANMSMAINRPNVNATMISNCKSLGQKFTNVIGLTLMFPKGVQQDEDGAPIYDLRQSYHISKGRKGKGGNVPFFRQYDYQRMTDVTGRNQP